MFLRIIKQVGQIPDSDVKVRLTSEALQLQTKEKYIQLVISWDEVESITENEQGFQLLIPDKPDVYLAKDKLPAEWQSGLASSILE